MDLGKTRIYNRNSHPTHKKNSGGVIPFAEDILQNYQEAKYYDAPTWTNARDGTARPYYCVSNCTIGPYFNSFHDLSSLRKHVYGNSHLQNMTVRNYKAFLNELVELNNKCPDHKLIICLNAQCPFFTDARIVESKQHRC